MAATCSRRRILAYSGATLLGGTAGCLDGIGGTGSGTEWPTDRPTTTHPDVSDDEAERRALDAEESYISARLDDASCVESWGLTGYTGIDRNATVVERTADGVTVEVTHPYWHSTDRDEADGGTSATYVVADDRTERVAGDGVSPC